LNDKLNGKFTDYHPYGDIARSAIYKDGTLQSITEYTENSPRFNIEITYMGVEFYKAKFISYYSDSIVTNNYRISKNNLWEETITESPFTFAVLFIDEINQLSGVTKSCLDGEYIVEDNTGLILKDGFYKCGIKSETWNTYYYDQNLKCQAEYNDDSIVSEHFYTIDLNDTYSGKLTVYGRRGELLQEIKIKDGLRNGKTIYFDRNGKSKKTEKYKDGILNL
jgi:antitoxin component YwqK of YwqJK toxin-antitoxin module